MHLYFSDWQIQYYYLPSTSSLDKIIVKLGEESFHNWQKNKILYYRCNEVTNFNVI